MFEEIKRNELNKIAAELASIKSSFDETIQLYENTKKEEPQYKEYTWVQKHITKRKEYKDSRDDFSKKEDAFYSKLHDISEKRDRILDEERKLQHRRDIYESSYSLKELGLESLSQYQEYCKLNNINEDIETMCLNYPEETCMNKEFMMNAIQINLFNIKYDKTNDTDLYRAYAQLLYSYLSGLDNSSFIEIQSGKVMDIIEILNNKDMNNNESDRRFIEYLKESLKTIDEKLFIPDVKEAYELFNTEYGRELEELYQNTDVIVGVHGTGYYEEDNSILKNGIRTSAQDKEALNNLSRTVAYNLPFLRLLTYNGTQYAGAKGGMQYNYIVCLPKNALEPDSNTPIWGGNDDNLSHDYLLPEYVYGVYDIKSDGSRIIKYNGPKTKYEKLYVDQSVTPLEESRKL